MKNIEVIIIGIYIMLFSLNLKAQTYTYSPAIGDYVNSPTANTQGVTFNSSCDFLSTTNYTGGQARVSIVSHNTSTNTINFRIIKDPVGQFQSGGIATIVFANESFAKCVSYSTGYYANIEMTTTLYEGVNSFDAYLHSSAGGYYYAGHVTITKTNANQNPTVSISNCPSSYITTETFDFSYSGSDTDGSISGYYVDIDDSSPDNWTTNTLHGVNINNLSTGWHNFYVKSKDNDGAYSTVKSCQFYADYTAPTAVISLSGNLAFGNVQVGSTPTKILTIKNTGNTTLSVSSINYPSGFSGNFSGNILAGSTKDITVTFAPTQAVSYSGNITVNSNASSGTYTTAISGTGTAAPTAVISLSGNLAFGNIQVGSTPTKTLTIRNTGNATLSVSSINYPSGFSGNFSGNILAGSTKDITVTFAPTQAVSYSGNITINSNASSGTYTTAISGTGTGITFTYISPTKNNIYNTGIQLPIEWTISNFTGNIRFQLTDENNNVISGHEEIGLYSDTENSFNWNIPTSLATGLYKIKAYSSGVNPPSFVAFSEVFSITDPNFTSDFEVSKNELFIRNPLEFTDTFSIGGTKTIIDVLVLYPSSLTNSPDLTIGNVLRKFEDNVNNTFKNSKINLLCQVVDVVEVNDDYFENTPQDLLDKYSADIVIYVKNEKIRAGANQIHQIFATTEISRMNINKSDLNSITVAHEIGHLLGCSHNKGALETPELYENAIRDGVNVSYGYRHTPENWTKFTTLSITKKNETIYGFVVTKDIINSLNLNDTYEKSVLSKFENIFDTEISGLFAGIKFLSSVKEKSIRDDFIEKSRIEKGVEIYDVYSIEKQYKTKEMYSTIMSYTSAEDGVDVDAETVKDERIDFSGTVIPYWSSNELKYTYEDNSPETALGNDECNNRATIIRNMKTISEKQNQYIYIENTNENSIICNISSNANWLKITTPTIEVKGGLSQKVEFSIDWIAEENGVSIWSSEIPLKAEITISTSSTTKKIHITANPKNTYEQVSKSEQHLLTPQNIFVSPEREKKVFTISNSGIGNLNTTAKVLSGEDMLSINLNSKKIKSENIIEFEINISDNKTQYLRVGEVLFSSLGALNDSIIISIVQMSNNNILNIDNSISINKILVYPNPSKGVFILNMNNQEIGKMNITITDIFGKQIKTMQFDKKQNLFSKEFDLSNYVQGIYVISIQINSNSYTNKLIIE